MDATWAHPSSLMLQIKTRTGASLQPHFPTVRKENVVVAQVSHSLVSNSLQPHGLQHARLPSPSLSPRVCSNSCPLSQQCHPTISTCVIPFFFLPSVFPNIRVFSNELALHIRWPKYWSFSISPSNNYSGLISFRIDCFDLFSVQRTLKSLLQHHSSKASFLRYSVFCMVQLSHAYMTTGKASPQIPE